MAGRSERDIQQRDRIIDAALDCLGRWGVAKTTLEDVARAAGCGRATIYRTFRGGKTEVLDAVLAREQQRCAAVLAGVLHDAADLEALLVGGATAGARYLRDHQVLQFLLAHEPDVILPRIAFDEADRLYGVIAALIAPHLGRFLPDHEVPRAAQWCSRVLVSYVLNPSERFDLTDQAQAERLVRTYVLPALDRSPRPAPSPAIGPGDHRTTEPRRPARRTDHLHHG